MDGVRQTLQKRGTLNVKIPYHCTNYALFQNFVYCISMIKKINYYTDIERDVDGYIYVLELLYYNHCLDVIL